VAFAAGLTSGCAGILVGQPFDTVKVRLQTAPLGAYSGPLRCLRDTVHKEGVTALFKGLGPPLASAPIVNAIAFAAYVQASKVSRVREPQLRLTTQEVFVAGAFAGACQTVVVLPTENIKTKLQVNTYARSTLKLQYKGAIDCATQLVRTQGLRSLLAGGTATVWREVPAYGIYFSVYEQVKALLKEKGAKEGVSAFAAGGIAGCSSWFAIAPLDVIKSRQQAMQDWRSKEASSLVACARGMYREGGHRIFFRGLGTIMVRAFPVNAVIFPIYEVHH
ncbi:solute carrier family 25 member 45-like protein, partial [Tribonema minus]